MFCQKENSSGNSWYLPDKKLLYFPSISPAAEKFCQLIQGKQKGQTHKILYLYIIWAMISSAWDQFAQFVLVRIELQNILFK